MKRALLCGFAVTSFFLAGKTQAQVSKQSTLAPCLPSVSNDNPSMLPYLSFTSRGTFDPAPREEELASVAVASLAGGHGYTRLKMRFIPCPTSGRRYDDENRGWIRRLFAGKTVSKLLTIKASVATPVVSTINTVATIGRDSSRKKGEAWSTEITNSRWLTPYFRINSESVVNIDVNLAASTDYTSSVSTDALDLLKRATSVISPASTLITSLNKERFNDAASFVDTSINAFFKQSVIERATNDFQIRAGHSDLGAVMLHLPLANDTLAGASPVGVWVISTDRIISSIFQPSANGSIDYAKLTPSTVMNFSVAPNQSLQQALSSKANVAAARDALLKAKNAAEIVTASIGLCSALATESEAIGLSPIDVGAVSWAYRETLALGKDHYGPLGTACNRLPQAPPSV